MLLETEKAITTITDKLSSWLDTFLELIPNMILSVILLILFIFLAKIGSRLFEKIFNKTSDNQVLNNLFSTILYYAILGFGLFIILGVLGLEKALTSALAGVGIVGLALGFAFQDIAANFVSGVILAFRTPFHVGEIVDIKGVMGSVQRTNLRVTVVKTFQGQEVYIPNKDVLQSNIFNYSILGKRRIDLTVGVSYGDDLQKVEELVINTVSNLDGVIDKENLIFDYHEFGDSSINFNIRFWVKYPDQPGYLGMKHKAIKAIKRAFDDNDITIPFPIRTLDFGIKGGEKLSEMPVSIISKTATGNSSEGQS
ncbi:mechanosensitive ion channel family protein [Marinigracilibium pacificum]|uniref:Mechanosensitive ion channel family protein n=1 Tax=Marinigracilibium pacificum TaxID=2729599 RepID=A0A848IZA5_9BACT|nr:mechanosensitive ion channel family protein [Marinigracilibium pacificum]NMM47329.1 mechanosensitive ion channel family protein [Marinigracilibium pacificum]